MRRIERTALLLTGASLSPIAGAWRASWGAAPLAAAVVLIAVVSNVSAVRRLAAIRAGVRRTMP
jgi:hypothetical protein